MSTTTSTRIRISENSTNLKIRDLPLEILVPDPNQPRQTFVQESLKELADSITRHGLLQPITVKQKRGQGGIFMVVAGERRYRAFQILGRETIPAIVTTGNADEIALIENLQREDLSPLDEAKALLKLKKKHEYTLDELGASVGKAKSTVSEILKINDLPRKIKNEVRMSEHVGRSFLIELTRLPDEKQQLKLWKDVRRGNLTIRELRKKKRGPTDTNTDSSTKRVLTLGKRFTSELIRLTEQGEELSDEGYDQVLEIYQQFLKFFEENPKSSG